MRLNPKLKADIAGYFDYTIIVEGKKDVAALNSMGFEKVYAIHENSVPIRERIVQLSEIIGRKEKVCILTDFDKKGKQLYMLIKSEMQALGMKLDSSLRGLIIKAQVSHIEGLSTFMDKVDKIY